MRSYTADWAGPSSWRPLPPVIMALNRVVRGGTTARNVIGTDIAGPGPAVN